MAERGVVEKFVEQIAGGVQEDTVVVMCTPWIGSPLPSRVLRCAPTSMGRGATLDSTEMSQLRHARIVLVPCNLQTPGEEETTKYVIQQIAMVRNEGAFMLLVVVLEEELRKELHGGSREAADRVVERHARALRMGTDTVIVNPRACPRKFNESVELAHIKWSYNVARCKDIMEAQPDEVELKYLEGLTQNFKTLLWDKIPRAMLRNFPPCDPYIPETANSVGHYEFSQVLETRRGIVLQALDRRSQTDFVVKVTEKSEVVALYQVEDLYREFLFLKCTLTHPNINKCRQLIHTPSRLYMILNFCGSQNLAQFLHDQPNKRLEGVDREACLKQLVAAVAHCHSHNVAHREISLEHIAVMRLSETNSLQCTLVDFRKAMLYTEGKPASTKCGTLPCIAPEILLGSYMPLDADCWSVGIVLLEMAGGLGAVQRAVGYGGEEDVMLAATSVQSYFEAAGSHHEVLKEVANTIDPSFVELAEMLVSPVPEERADIVRVAADLNLTS